MLPEELKKAMRQSGLTNYRIAMDTGVDQTLIGRFLSGKRTITIETAGKLAKFLGFELVKKRKAR